MDSNYIPLIKQEFLNENENIATVLSDADINIPVKNEPIPDEDTPFVIIKHETLIDTPFGSIHSNKNENQLETQSASVDSFVIYEFKTLQDGKQTKSINRFERPTFQIPSYTNVSSINNSNLPLNSNGSDNINLGTQLNNAISPTSVNPSNTTPSIPILLNSQLRKRNKIVLPVSSLDKRTRYNIEGTLTKHRNSVIPSSSEISSTTPTTQTCAKKIINHLIKHKHVQRKQETRINEESLKRDLLKLKSAPIAKSMENNVTKVEDMNCQTFPLNIESPTTMIALQDNILTKPDLTPTTTKSAAAAIPCELRVKCLCRLTVDRSQTTDGDNSELIHFFKEMFDKTRLLSKKQQRDVKMALLQSISEAENAVEQGKCCCL